MDLLTDDFLLEKKSKAPSFKPNPTKSKSQSRANAVPRAESVAKKSDETTLDGAHAAPSAPQQNAMPAELQVVTVNQQEEEELSLNASAAEVQPRARVRFAAVSSHALDKGPASSLREVLPAKSNDLEVAASSLLEFKSHSRGERATVADPKASSSIKSTSSYGLEGWTRMLTRMRENLYDKSSQASAAKRTRKSKSTNVESAAPSAMTTSSRRRRRPKKKASVEDKEAEEEEEEEQQHEDAKLEDGPARKKRRKSKLMIGKQLRAAGLAFNRLPTGKEDEEVDPEIWSIREIIAKGQSWDKKKMEEAKKAKKDSQAGAPAEGEGAVGDSVAGPSSSAVAGALVPLASAPIVPAPPPAASSLGPRLQVINGQIVVDAASLTIQAQRPEDASSYTRIEEDTRLINSHSYMKKQTGERWKEDETKLFYRALRHFGTDFTLIAQLFPNRDRKHIKNKYNREIKTMPSQVNEALIGGKNPEETKELFEVILTNQRRVVAPT